MKFRLQSATRVLRFRRIILVQCESARLWIRVSDHYLELDDLFVYPSFYISFLNLRGFPALLRIAIPQFYHDAICRKAVCWCHENPIKQRGWLKVCRWTLQSKKARKKGRIKSRDKRGHAKVIRVSVLPECFFSPFNCAFRSGLHVCAQNMPWVESRLFRCVGRFHKFCAVRHQWFSRSERGCCCAVLRRFSKIFIIGSHSEVRFGLSNLCCHHWRWIRSEYL